MKKKIKNLGFIILFILIYLHTFFALAVEKPLELYKQRVYTSLEGLPQNSIFSIVQTPDGFIWLATNVGIARFDGFLPKPIQSHKLLTMMKRLLVKAGEKEPRDSKDVRRKQEPVVTQHSLMEEAKHSVHILLVEDNPLNQKLARFMLTKGGYRLDVVNNGKEAIEIYTNAPGKFDLIFMDINMPVMDGKKAAQTIRNKGFTGVPIIAMTAHALKEDRDACLQAGMNDYISKPIKREVVFNMVKKWVFEDDEL